MNPKRKKMIDYNAPYTFSPGQVTELSTELVCPSPYFFGLDIQEALPEMIETMTFREPADRLFFVTDETLMELLGENCLEVLTQRFPNVKPVFLPKGENAKAFGVLEKTCDRLIEMGASKRSVLLAFGGGSVGNLTGLAAGLIFRGIRFAEIPSTLSHQTDGTLSNKQAVNGRFGKNHFGLYHAPLLIWADTRYLAFESPDGWKAGIVEGIKNAFIDQDNLLPYLTRTLTPELALSPESLTELCFKIILSKIEILKKDPTEKYYGIILEYGHTFSHAMEWLAHGKISHGGAVAIGMKMAAALARRLGYIGQDLVNLHTLLLDEKLAVRNGIPDSVTAAAMMDTMRVDNKKSGRDLRFVLLEAKGRCLKGNGDYLIPVAEPDVAAIVETFIKN